MRPQRWIIFCRIVDYFGDAGFCWRLAVAIKALGVPQVTLVIDRLNILDELRGSQRVPGVTVLPWNVAEDRWKTHGVRDEEKADVVIEAFTCDPPLEYLRALPAHAQWFTMDYLATEPWADTVHGAPSPAPRLNHPMAARRRWVVPGFSAATAGLLHGAWRHISFDERSAWRDRLVRLGRHAPFNKSARTSPRALSASHAAPAHSVLKDDVFLILAFGYADADWDRLMALAKTNCPDGKQPVIWQPQGIAFSQTEFDEILQSCDLNFVRGEDSFVRAHWAAAGPWAVPFIWQPYRQQQRAHGHKLAGWLHQLARHPQMAAFADLHWAWNGIRPADADPGLTLDAAWRHFVQVFSVVRARLHRECLRLAQMESLEARLLSLTCEGAEAKMAGSANDRGSRP